MKEKLGAKEPLVGTEHKEYQNARQLERFLGHEQDTSSPLENALRSTQIKIQPGGYYRALFHRLETQKELIALFQNNGDTQRVTQETEEMLDIETQITTQEKEIKQPLVEALNKELESAVALARINKNNDAYSRYTKILFEEVEKVTGRDFAPLTESNIEELCDIATAFEELCDIATAFLDMHEKEKNEYEAFAKVVQEDFTRDIHTAVANGALPTSANANLKEIPRILWKLMPTTETWDESGKRGDIIMGEHHGCGVVKITTPIFVCDKEMAKHTAYHEILHEIGGRARHYMPRPIDDDFKHSKSGFSTGRIGAFTWLDEATTEYLALELLDTKQKKSKSYVTERAKLQELFEKGLNKMLVWEAYFEDITRDQEKERRGEKYKALVQAINNTEGVGGFTRIEHEFILINAAYDAKNLLQEAGFTQAKKAEAITFPETAGEEVTYTHTKGIPATHRITLTAGTYRDDTHIAQQHSIEIVQPKKSEQGNVEDALTSIKKRLLQSHRALRIHIETL